MLAVENLRVVYREVISILHGISLQARAQEITVILGANGAGKTTLLRAIAGLLRIYDGSIIEGEIRLGDVSIKGMESREIVKKYGLTYVMEDRPVFWYLTVEENLAAAAYSRWDGAVKSDIEKVFNYFPVLRNLRHQQAGYTSGGEQQMLALGMSLMTKPKILLFDEPSLGLAPLVMEELFRIIQKLNQEGLTILLVEQNAQAALQIGNRGYVLENGRVVLEGEAPVLLTNEDVREFYLGVGTQERRSYQESKRYKRRKRWL